MATHTLPKISELDPLKVAKGSDVLANDQSLSTFINGQNLDQNNINPGMTPQWTAVHRFSADVYVDQGRKLYLDSGNDTYLTSTADRIEFYANNTQLVVMEQAKMNMAVPLDLQGLKMNIDADGDSFLRSDADESISMYLNAIEKENINLTAGITNKNLYGETVNQYITDTSGTGTANLFLGTTTTPASVGFQFDSITGNTGIRTGGTVTGTLRSDGTLLLPDVDSPAANHLARKSGAKAWGSYVDNVGFDASFNIDALTDDDGDGVYNITFDTDFATNNYCVIASHANAGATTKAATADVISASEIQVVLVNVVTHLAEDDHFNFVAFGEQ